MIPFYFGDAARQLFGIFHAGSPSSGPTRAVVLCNSWGPEYIHSHPTVRQAAVQLAAAGFQVLRFDYFGTGDSAGDMTDASIAMWEDDVRSAMHEVSAMSGARRATLIGLRFGAAIAARVAAADPDKIDQLLLWDPVLRGARYLDELIYNCRNDPQRFRELRRRADSVGGGREMHGFPLTDAMERDIRALDIGRLRAELPLRSGALISGPEQDEATARQELMPPLVSSSIERIAALPCWIDQWASNTRSLPVAVLNRLVERALDAI